MTPFPFLLSADFARAAIRVTTPLVGASLGEVMVERSGFVNIGVEGLLLLGAFFGVVGSWWTHCVWGGVLLALAVGAVGGLLLTWISIFLGVNQVVAGAALNLAAAGLTTFLNREIFGQNPPAVPGFEAWPVPLLDRIPIVGPILFDQIPLVYLVYLLAPLGGLILFRTNWGLRLRAVGEKPRAAASAGVRVRRYRMVALVIGGMLASLGGTYYSLGTVRFFTENMTSGNGFIALAVVIVARWNPYWLIPVSLLFGGAGALALRAQAFHVGIPFEFLFMLPYLLTMLIYGGVIGPARPPASLGTDEAAGD
jgi:simple sugar transport system permease protein